MTRVVVENAVKSKLTKLHGRAELFDEEGCLLGYFTPIERQYERSEPTISDDELLRRENQEDSYSTAQVKAHLESL